MIGPIRKVESSPPLDSPSIYKKHAYKISSTKNYKKWNENINKTDEASRKALGQEEELTGSGITISHRYRLKKDL